MLSLWPRSLAFRVVAFSTIWAVVALIAISTVITTLYRQASQRGFESLLSAHLFNLISSVGVSEAGTLSGSPDLGDLRFSQRNSGWYWAVEPVSKGFGQPLRSASMTAAVSSPSTNEVGFDRSFQRVYRTTGPAGEVLQVIESEFVLDADNRIARFRVMGNRTELEAEIAGFQRRLFFYLALFGVGTILINAVAILLGLRPLHRVREALSMVRGGTARRLDGWFPAEIEPLANETNVLIENNRRIVERARTQVGNLAHSLKTPLSVLINEGRAIGGPKGKLIEEQSAAMQAQLEHYLQRARVAAQRDSVIYRTPVSPLLARMVRVIQRLNPGKTVSLGLPAADILFAGEAEDLEEIVGNLMENAAKWSRSLIEVQLSLVRVGEGEGVLFSIRIEDDGPGIPEEKAKDALRRGKRLDETMPGTGLGLAIVSDLVNEYGGHLALGRAGVGGLSVEVKLPAAR